MRDRRYRDEQRLSVVEGPRALDGALASGATVEAIFARPGRLTRHLDGRAGHLYQGTVYEVPAPELDSLADAVNPQGVMGVVRFDDASIDDLVNQRRVVLLDGLRNPGNTGAVARSAAAAGFGGIAATAGTTDMFSPKALRAAAGLTLGLHVCRNVDTTEVLERLGDAGHLRIRSAVDSDLTLDEMARLPEVEHRPVTLVVGNEAVGLSEQTVRGTDLAVSIPMCEPVDSLNVAVATGVLMYALSVFDGRAPYPAPNA